MTAVQPSPPGTPAHARPVAEVLAELGVDPRQGLTADEAARRLADHGPNELEAAPRDPAWRRLFRQLQDLLILILLAAAVVSFVVSGELKTPIVVLVVVVVNAIIGFVQENRAEASLDALRKMLVLEVRVRRSGSMRTVPAAELVPGDVVAVEAGDRIPADGRLVHAVQLEVEEAGLTGESLPVAKGTDPVGVDAPVADRTSMVHMQTTVTRGRAELVVTTTGMGTEIGRIAHLLRTATSEKTPLQRQLDRLAHSLARLAGVIVLLVVVIGLLRGQSLSDLMLTAVALAVATIPEGLPAVTAVTLAIGVSKMARENAVVKRLASVETLGCTTVICSDKTGTLTLNQMTAEAVIVVGGRRMGVTGSGYDPSGTVEVPVDLADQLAEVFDAMALCSDASLQYDEVEGWGIVGDPTEGALVVLAAKAGVDAPRRRAEWPRVGEVPFDSTHKLMATLHERDDGRLRLFAKGAPDALLARAAAVVGPDGTPVPVEELRAELEELNAELAHDGMRVLALASRDLPRHGWDQLGEPLEGVRDLLLLGLVGIADPVRSEAAVAIAAARGAGIQVKMITGDHPATAAAIGRQLGLGGPAGEVVAVTGRDLDAMDDDELDRKIDEVSVFARVSPEHKLRLVSALQGRGEVVAMTGDGVNDAPALRRADMGIAMGITGTEVTKEAATMVLTDDNFATIVEAVRRGRGIYDNIVKFVRFQLSTTLGFAALFLAAAVLGVASGKPFTAIAILWVNIIMDGPPAMALGLDPVDDSVMERGPRPRDEPILTRPRWGAIATAGAVMAVGTLAVLAFAPGAEPMAGEATIAGTMAFNTFVLFQFFNILNVRSDDRSVLRRVTLTNRPLWIALGCVLALQVAVTHLGPMQRLFDTTGISVGQWLVCIAVASSVLVIEEARKAWRRARG